VNADTLQDVIDFIAKQTGMPVSQITPATRLGEDLGVDGDDASEFLTAFASHFHVDLAKFEFSRDFGPEAGWIPFIPLPSRPEPVTVKALTEAVEKGAWSNAV